MKKIVKADVNFNSGIHGGSETETMTVILTGEEADVLTDIVINEGVYAYAHGVFDEKTGPAVKVSFEKDKDFGTPLSINPTMRRVDGTWRLRLPLEEFGHSLDGSDVFNKMNVALSIQEW